MYLRHRNFIKMVKFFHSVFICPILYIYIYRERERERWIKKTVHKKKKKTQIVRRYSLKGNMWISYEDCWINHIGNRKRESKESIEISSDKRKMFLLNKEIKKASSSQDVQLMRNRREHFILIRTTQLLNPRKDKRTMISTPCQE